jgi:hypothetical protein
MYKGTFMIHLINALHAHHIALRVNPTLPDRLSKGTATGAKIVYVIIISLSTVITCNLSHTLHHLCPYHSIELPSCTSNLRLSWPEITVKLQVSPFFPRPKMPAVPQKKPFVMDLGSHDKGLFLTEN